MSLDSHRFHKIIERIYKPKSLILLTFLPLHFQVGGADISTDITVCARGASDSRRHDCMCLSTGWYYAV